jgi:hypothetical protein
MRYGAAFVYRPELNDDVMPILAKLNDDAMLTRR